VVDRESGMLEGPESGMEGDVYTYIYIYMYIYDVACLGNPSFSLKLYFH
jgi:hypothetical protein